MRMDGSQRRPVQGSPALNSRPRLINGPTYRLIVPSLLLLLMSLSSTSLIHTHLFRQADHLNAGCGHQSGIDHFGDDGDGALDIFGRVHNRDGDGPVAADQMAAVQFGCFAITFQATEYGGPSDLQFPTLGHDRFIKRLALVPVRF